MRSERSRWSFLQWSLDKKLIFFYALMIIIPILVVTLFGFQRYEQNLTERVSEFGLNLTDQISKNMDNYLSQIDHLSMTFYFEGTDGFSVKRDPMNIFTEKKTVDRAMRNLMFIIPFHDIEGIYWIHDGEVQYSQYGSGKWIDHSQFKAEGWYDKVVKADGTGVIIPPYRPKTAGAAHAAKTGSESVTGSEAASKDEPYIFSYARSIVNVKNRMPYGVLLIDLSTSSFYELLNEAKVKTSSSLFIVDEAGQIIYHPDTAYIGETFKPELPGSFGKFTTTEWQDGQPTMVQFVRSEETGWTIVNTVPVKQLSQELSIIRNLLWVFAGVALVLSIIMSSVFTMNITKPLKTMKRMMHRVELGDYNVRIHDIKQDEVGQLGRSFNHMVEKINELVSRVLTMKIFQQQAEFKVLQSQINPHFLYNTLESINMKAEINQDYEVADMVSLLGKLFRLSLQQTTGLIPLSREMEYVEVYMKLQNIRFPHMKYTIMIDDSFMELHTLPWIVQPLVENAIVHGIAPMKGQGQIVVRSECIQSGQDQMLFIHVEDNGCGMSVERLDQVNGWLQRPVMEDDSDQHIGLGNVHRRIRSTYGMDYGLTITRLPDKGTRVSLNLKVTMKEEQAHAEIDHCG